MKSFSNTINPGEKLRLRDDVLPLVKRRSWIFAGTGKGNRILLGHGYVWEAKPDSIDWEEYQTRKDIGSSFSPANLPNRPDPLPEVAR